MKSIKSVITPLATVATAFSCGMAGAESITVKMEPVREDSVEHLFQPMLMRLPIGPQLTEGLPEIQSVAGLEIMSPCTPACRFLDSSAEPIVVLGLDNDGQDIAFAVADSTEQAAATPAHGRFFQTHSRGGPTIRANRAPGWSST